PSPWASSRSAAPPGASRGPCSARGPRSRAASSRSRPWAPPSEPQSRQRRPSRRRRQPDGGRKQGAWARQPRPPPLRSLTSSPTDTEVLMQRRDGFLVKIKIKDERGNVVDEVEAIAFKGLLNIAHEEGLKLVETTVVQLPTEENGKTAVVTARVVTS